MRLAMTYTKTIENPRQTRYRNNHPERVNAARTKQRANRETEFTCIDGEGQTGKCRECDCSAYRPGAFRGWRETCESCGHYRNATQGKPKTGHVHNYVLLGIGSKQITNAAGLGWEEIFEFLYSQLDPYTTYAGFFLGYDFTQWFKTLPERKAVQLLTQKGIRKRKYTTPAGTSAYHPVKIKGKRTAGEVAGRIPEVRNAIHRGDLDSGTPMVWEAHFHADRRLLLRPKICCKDAGDTHTRGAEHRRAPGMYICDTGGFFQMSFLKVIDPEEWSDPVVNAEEYELVKKGKSDRAAATLGPEMMRYNKLENEILSRVLKVYDTGFKELGIRLNKMSWYGPGQVAQAWLKTVLGNGYSKDMQAAMSAEVMDAARKSYFGGIFEIMAHGIIPGITWEYDVNSAYPKIISELPCLLHSTWESNKSRKPRKTLPVIADNQVRLIFASVWGNDPYIGAMTHRTLDEHIMRPKSTRGWFWQHELEAAIRAGVVNRVECYEWHTLTSHPHNCEYPLSDIKFLYQKRLDIGKKTPLGIGIKLAINSAYGKFAQSIGGPPFASPVYASLITAGCRTMILDAIATHPEKTSAVLMIATDGIYFRTRHTSLPLSDTLGNWEETEKHNICLFKPGVYWDDKARDSIKDGGSAEFKSRGVSARELSTQVKSIDAQFRTLGDTLPADKKDWPSASFPLTFSMTSAKQAIRGNWEDAGLVTDIKVTHSSWPGEKRITAEYSGIGQQACGSRVPGDRTDGIYRSYPHYLPPSKSDGLPQYSKPYNKAFGVQAMYEDGRLDTEMYGITPDGLVKDHWYAAMQLR